MTWEMLWSGNIGDLAMLMTWECWRSGNTGDLVKTINGDLRLVLSGDVVSFP